jgi:hypothetical protein
VSTGRWYLITHHGEGIGDNERRTDWRVDEEHGPVSKEQRQKVRDWGEIKISFYFVKRLEEVSIAKVPGFDFEELGTLSEKAVHKTRLAGDTPTPSAGLCAPEHKKNGMINQVRTLGEGPFASFIFKYRSTSMFTLWTFHKPSLTVSSFPESLKDLGIIPHTPDSTPPRSPTPLYTCDPREMSEDERA